MKTISVLTNDCFATATNYEVIFIMMLVLAAAHLCGDKTFKCIKAIICYRKTFKIQYLDHI